jgi:ubiquinone biosynthesis protein COQ4
MFQVKWMKAATTKKSEPLYDGHIPINLLQRAILSVGSSIVALTDPVRGGDESSKNLNRPENKFPFVASKLDMVAVNGESSGHSALVKMHRKMLESEEGQQILM